VADLKFEHGIPPFPGRSVARSGALMIYRVVCQVRHSSHFRECAIVLGRQGRFAPPSAVAFGQP
jgi:hypothetical protein